jgi:TonB family protein
VREKRHRKASIPLGRTLLIVVGIHALVGLGLVLAARTEVGKDLIKTYAVKLKADKPPPPKDDQNQPPPPPPPPTTVQSAQLADVASSAPASSSVSIGADAGGSGALTYGGKFQAGNAGNLSALDRYTRGVGARFKRFYNQPEGEFAAFAVEFDVAATGDVRSYRLARSSGNPKNDHAVMLAADRVRHEGVGPSPDGVPMHITLHGRLDGTIE